MECKQRNLLDRYWWKHGAAEKRGDCIYNSSEVLDFPVGTVDGNPPARAGDTGLIPGSGRFHMLQSN